MSLLVEPSDSLYNQPIEISAVNLLPHELYKIKLHFCHSLGTFCSYGIFRANGGGTIDLRHAAPIRGTYNGTRQMGLFESLEPCTDFRRGGYMRFSGKELDLNYEIFLHNISGNVIDKKNIKKRYQAPNVERIEIEVEKIRGVLFKPEGDGPFPTIMDVLGTGGGLSEHRAAALASEGFCVLVIAYFQYKDLPQVMYEVDQQYFIDCINWLTSQSFTTEKIGLHGSSFGGILVLLLAKICSKVEAVVSINPPHCMNNYAHIQRNGEPIPHAEASAEYFKFRGDILIYDQSIRHLQINKSNDMHFEEIPKHIDIRFVVSLDDVSTSAIYSTKYLTEKLSSTGHYVEYDAVPGGHVMEPPYYPYHAYCFSRLANGYMAYGGEASIHGISQVNIWKRTVNFFKTRITVSHESPYLVCKL